jgi:hypothetical protein
LKVVAWPVFSTINVSFFKTQWLGFSTSHAVGNSCEAGEMVMSRDDHPPKIRNSFLWSEPSICIHVFVYHHQAQFNIVWIFPFPMISL